jgi:hypothetical protein
MIQQQSRFVLSLVPFRMSDLWAMLGLRHVICTKQPIPVVRVGVGSATLLNAKSQPDMSRYKTLSMKVNLLRLTIEPVHYYDSLCTHARNP